MARGFLVLLVGRGHEALVVSSSLGLALHYPEPHCPSWVLLPGGCQDHRSGSESCQAAIALSATGAIAHALSLL